MNKATARWSPGERKLPHGRWPSRRALLLVLTAAAVLRIVFFAFSTDHVERQIAPDSLKYLALGENLAAGRGFGTEPPSEPGSWRPELFRTPGYPAIIALLQRATGSAVAGTIIFQHVLGVCLCGIVMVVCSRTFGRRAGLWAGVLMALDLQGIALGNLVLTAGPYAFLLFTSLLAAVRLVSRPSVPVALLTGVLIGVSTLVRPTSIALPTLVGFLVLARGVFSRDQRAVLAGLTVFLIGNAFIGGWVVRNGRATGEYTPSTAGRGQLLYCHAAETLAWARGERSRDEAFQELLTELDLTREQVVTHPLGPVENRAIREIAFRTILENKSAFLASYVLKTANLLLSPDKRPLRALGVPLPSLGFLNPRGRASPTPVGVLLMAFQVIHLGILYVLALRAGWAIVRRRSAVPLVWLAAAYSLYVLGLSAGPPGDPRYRWPIIPMIVVVAVSSLAQSSSTVSSDPDREVSAVA